MSEAYSKKIDMLAVELNKTPIPLWLVDAVGDKLFDPPLSTTLTNSLNEIRNLNSNRTSLLVCWWWGWNPELYSSQTTTYFKNMYAAYCVSLRHRLVPALVAGSACLRLDTLTSAPTVQDYEAGKDQSAFKKITDAFNSIELASFNASNTRSIKLKDIPEFKVAAQVQIQASGGGGGRPRKKV